MTPQAKIQVILVCIVKYQLSFIRKKAQGEYNALKLSKTLDRSFISHIMVFDLTIVTLYRGNGTQLFWHCIIYQPHLKISMLALEPELS